MLDDYLSPQYRGYRSKRNPVRIHELRRMRWPKERQEITRYTILVIAVVSVLGLGIWLSGQIDILGRCLFTAASTLNSDKYCLRWAISHVTNTAEILGVVSLATSLVLDMFYSIVPINGILRDIHSGHWDLLRLTKLQSDDLIIAKYEVNQIRAWRVLPFEFALRVVAAIALSLTFLVLNWDSPDILTMLIVAIILMILCIIEPLWRMQALISVGVALALQIHDLTFAILGSILSILAMRLIQICIGSIGIYLMFQLVGGGPEFPCMVIFTAISIAVGTFGFYHIIQTIALHRIGELKWNFR